MNAWKSIAMIATIQVWALMAIESWIEILVQHQFSIAKDKLIIAIAALAIFAANHYALVRTGQGISFEQKFSHLAKNRKVKLVTVSLVLMAASVALFIYAATVHRRMFASPFVKTW